MKCVCFCTCPRGYITGLSNHPSEQFTLHLVVAIHLSFNGKCGLAQLGNVYAAPSGCLSLPDHVSRVDSGTHHSCGEIAYT